MCRQLRNEMHIDQFIPQVNHRKRLRINQIDPTHFCLRDVFFLNVARDSNYEQFVLLVGSE